MRPRTRPCGTLPGAHAPGLTRAPLALPSTVAASHVLALGCARQSSDGLALENEREVQHN